jgi:cyclopropane fatty-acyl-phospholipid synthase-like methyltransferase
MTSLLGSLLVLLAQAGAGGAAAGRADPGSHGPSHSHGRDRFKNPADLAAYVAHQEEPARQAWQKPDEVLRTLGVRKGQTVCDIGAGPGYFALRLASLVGASGRVYAVDVEPRILEILRDRVAAAGTRQVTPVLGLTDDPLLPDGACDLALVVDTYHHFPDGAAYLRRLRRALAPRGRVVNIDFHKRPTPVGPEMEHRISREDFLRDARGAGLRVVAEPTFLENQYFLVLEPK